MTNPFNKRDFVVKNLEGQPELVVRRASFFPPVFHIIREKDVVGRVRLTSLLRNRYVIHTDDGTSWRFQLPLFDFRFRGSSDIRTDIWVVVGPAQSEWKILIRPGLSEIRLVTALAFIHHERWRYS